MFKLFNARKVQTDGVLSSYQILTLYLPGFILALGYSIAMPAVPVFAKSFDTGFAVASLVLVVEGFGEMIATVPTGFLVDRFGRRPMLFAGPLLTAAASFLIAVAHSFPELLAYRFIEGLGSEVWRQARLAMIADASRTRERGRQMSGMIGTERAGRLIGPAIGGLFALSSIRLPFIAYGTLAFLAIVPSFFLVRESSPGWQKPKKDREPQMATGALLKSMLTPRYLGFFTAQFFASTTRGVLWGGTLLLYATFAYGAGAQVLGGLATVGTIVGIPITFAAGYLMDRFGRKVTMVPGFILISLGIFYLAAGAAMGWSIATFIAGFLWIQSTGSITAGSMQVLGADMAPAAGRGRFFGFWRLINQGGSLVSPAVFAWIAERQGYSFGFILFGLCALMTALLLAFTVTETVSSEKITRRTSSETSDAKLSRFVDRVQVYKKK
ncbi:MAG TPA: MFS transporter [Candidatus Binatia bacterium]|jgi:MFS family permease